MSMTIDADALPDEPPPLANIAGVPMPSLPPAFSFGSLIQTVPQGFAPPSAPPGVDLGALAREAATIKRDETANKERIQVEEDARLQKHRAVMEQRFAQTGVNPEDFKPFNAEAAQEKYKYNPIEAFGSVGSVFAILASTFTNRPMENAMYGAAAAMNAVKAGNEQEYDRAYKTWQDNTNLAIKRQAAQHQSYNDAMSMVTTDMSIAQDRMKQAATKYGDKRMVLLLDQGLWGDAIELATKQNELGSKLADAQSNIMMEEAKQQIIRADPRFRSPDPNVKMQAVREVNAAFSDKSRETPADAHSRLLLEQLRADGEPDIVTKHREGMNKWYADVITGKPGVLTEGRINAAEFKRRKDEKVATGMDDTQAFRETRAEMDAEANKSGALGGSLTGRVLETFVKGAPAFANNTMPPEEQRRFVAAATEYAQPKPGYNPATGVYEMVRKDLPPEVKEAFRVRGMPIPGGEPSKDPPVVGPSAPSMMPRGVDLQAATGVQGVLTNIANTVSDSLGMGLMSPKADVSIKALQQLHAITVTTVQDAVPGKPSVYLLQKLDRLAVEPASLLVGEKGALNRFKQTRDLLASGIAETTAALSNPGLYSPTQVTAARMKRLEMMTLLSSYETIIEDAERKIGSKEPLDLNKWNPK